MYYVMGKDELGRVILMTQKAFTSETEAQCYSDSCNKEWKAFVVKTV